MASDKAAEINMELAEEIYNTANEGLDVLKNLTQFLIDLMAQVKSMKGVNITIDNT